MGNLVKILPVLLCLFFVSSYTPYEYRQVSFDGVNESLSAPSSNYLQVGNGSVDTQFVAAICFIKRSSSATNTVYLMGKGSGTTQWRLRISGGFIEFTLLTDGSNYLERQYQVDVSSLITDMPQWIGVAYDASETAGGLQIWMNGVALTTTNTSAGSYTGCRNNSGRFRIAQSVGSDTTLYSEIDVKYCTFWKNKAASFLSTIFNDGYEPNMSSLSEYSTKCMLDWRMADNNLPTADQYPTIHDQSGHGNNGSMSSTMESSDIILPTLQY